MLDEKTLPLGQCVQNTGGTPGSFEIVTASAGCSVALFSTIDCRNEVNVFSTVGQCIVSFNTGTGAMLPFWNSYIASC